jgi:hypothetical protein
MRHTLAAHIRSARIRPDQLHAIMSAVVLIGTFAGCGEPAAEQPTVEGHRRDGRQEAPNSRHPSHPPVPANTADGGGISHWR